MSENAVHIRSTQWTEEDGKNCEIKEKRRNSEKEEEKKKRKWFCTISQPTVISWLLRFLPLLPNMLMILALLSLSLLRRKYLQCRNYWAIALDTNKFSLCWATVHYSRLSFSCIFPCTVHQVKRWLTCATLSKFGYLQIVAAYIFMSKSVLNARGSNVYKLKSKRHAHALYEKPWHARFHWMCVPRLFCSVSHSVNCALQFLHTRWAQAINEMSILISVFGQWFCREFLPLPLESKMKMCNAMLCAVAITRHFSAHINSDENEISWHKPIQSWMRCIHWYSHAADRHKSA